MSSTISSGEKAQLEQTIEMFEVITQSQPQDCQSLEILKEAYSKLGRDADVVKTSKRIAEAYVQLGQLSSAILEYETILQHHPGDPDVQAALKALESRATNFASQPAPTSDAAAKPAAAPAKTAKARTDKTKTDKPTTEDDGRGEMYKFFVDTKIISAGDFDLCWHSPDLESPPNGVIEPFIQLLADKNIVPIEKSLKVLVEKARLAYLPLDKYDIDADLTRDFPAEACQRWCVLPFDRMSKSVLVATANPFNKRAAQELAAITKFRIIWYLAAPVEIVKNLRKVFK
jgi:tetratricopeptide (TPR) repeat protein